MCAYNFLPPLTSFHILLSFQILLSSCFLLFLMPFQGLPQAGGRAGPEPRRGGLIGDHAGGTLRGRPPQRPARALPRPGPHAPIPNAPSTGSGGVGASGRPRTSGTRCVVLRGETGCVVLWGEGLYA